ncbi:MAG: hypothetical protein RMM17_11440 [Acidobacteriota bacterium]|nr:hypothetical protein [Blastocatellia bacterium]MDW8413285.1 hypothetical protein [Acidobacteriota bacterium]
MRNFDELVTLSRRSHALGYRRRWQSGDELVFERGRLPCLYLVEKVAKLADKTHLFLRRHGKVIQVEASDNRLIHIPRPEDVQEWFDSQAWLDLYVLRCSSDASWEAKFYYHEVKVLKVFCADDPRLCSLRAMVGALELLHTAPSRYSFEEIR